MAEGSFAPIPDRNIESRPRDPHWERATISWSGRSGALSKSTNLAAKQFDLIVFRAELALLQVDAAFASRRARIAEIASLLEALRRPYSGL
jgi:hypothetical protein